MCAVVRIRAVHELSELLRLCSGRICLFLRLRGVDGPCRGDTLLADGNRVDLGHCLHLYVDPLLVFVHDLRQKLLLTADKALLEKEVEGVDLAVSVRVLQQGLDNGLLALKVRFLQAHAVNRVFEITYCQVVVGEVDCGVLVAQFVRLSVESTSSLRVCRATLKATLEHQPAVVHTPWVAKVTGLLVALEGFRFVFALRN